MGRGGSEKETERLRDRGRLREGGAGSKRLWLNGLV